MAARQDRNEAWLPPRARWQVLAPGLSRQLAREKCPATLGEVFSPFANPAGALRGKHPSQKSGKIYGG